MLLTAPTIYTSPTILKKSLNLPLYARFAIRSYKITYPRMLNAVEAQILNFNQIKKHLPFKISADYMLTLSRIL